MPANLAHPNLELHHLNMAKKVYRDGPSPYSLLGTASTIGLHMISAPVVGGLLGYGADRLLGSWPVGAGIGFFLGVVAGFRMVWKDYKYLQRNQDVFDEDRSKPDRR